MAIYTYSITQIGVMSQNEWVTTKHETYKTRFKNILTRITRIVIAYVSNNKN